MNSASVGNAFRGHADFADILRLALIVFGIMLIWVIGRTLCEAYWHHELQRGQWARYGGVIFLDISDVFGVMHNFGRGAFWTIWPAVFGIAMLWYGTLQMRWGQRNRDSNGTTR